jgi:hypothetical protein
MAPDCTCGSARLDDQEIDLPRHQVLHRRPGAAIGHEGEMDAGLLLEIGAGDMAACGRIALRRLFGIGLQPGDETSEVVRRQRLPADDHQRIPRHQADRLEIPDEVVGQRIDRAVHHMGSHWPMSMV